MEGSSKKQIAGHLTISFHTVDTHLKNLLRFTLAVITLYSMKTRIIQIGNSQGIRIPKVLLEQSGLLGEVELEVKDRQIIIRTIHQPREGWDGRFQALAENGDDELLDRNALPYQSSWDEKEWTW